MKFFIVIALAVVAAVAAQEEEKEPEPFIKWQTCCISLLTPNSGLLEKKTTIRQGATTDCDAYLKVRGNGYDFCMPTKGVFDDRDGPSRDDPWHQSWRLNFNMF